MLQGTDSLASNTSLSMLEEMKGHPVGVHPEIPTEEMNEWATKNAAGFFGYRSTGLTGCQANSRNGLD
jgi:cytosine/adenosine deaminase-related metal-dependent hydrolase